MASLGVPIRLSVLRGLHAICLAWSPRLVGELLRLVLSSAIPRRGQRRFRSGLYGLMSGNLRMQVVVSRGLVVCVPPTRPLRLSGHCPSQKAVR